MATIYEVETQKGNRSIIVGDFQFRFGSQLKNGVIVWRCTNKYCGACIRTDKNVMEIVAQENEHCHLPFTEQQKQRKLLKAIIIKKVEENQLSTPKALRAELKQIGSNMSSLGCRDYNALSKCVYRKRRKTTHAGEVHSSDPHFDNDDVTTNITGNKGSGVKRKPSRKGKNSVGRPSKKVKFSESGDSMYIKVEPQYDDDEDYAYDHWNQEAGDQYHSLRDEAAQKLQSQDPGMEKPKGGGPKNVDIMQILSGAQQRYESKSKVGGPEPQAGYGGLVKPTPVKGTEGEGPRNLQELFQNVKLTQQMQHAGDPPPDVTINPLHRSLSVTEVESQSRAPQHSAGMTVEEIERRQRAQIRVPDRSLSVGGAVGGQGMSQSPVTKDLLSIIAAAAVGDGQGGSLPAMPGGPQGDVGAKGGMLAMSDSGSLGRSELMTPGDFDKHLTQKEVGPGALGTCPDVLMTPMAFATPQRPPSTGVSQAALLERLKTISSPVSSPTNTSPPPVELTPLTRQQLQQALIHMIRTDEDFIGNVHEAYLASFRSAMGGKR